MQLLHLLASLGAIANTILASPIAEALEGLEKRNILVPGDLIAAGTVILAGLDPQTVSPIRMPTSVVDLSNNAAKRDLTAMRDLVPSTIVDLATDTQGPSFTGTPMLMPSTVEKIGSTPGCSVWMSRYKFGTERNETGYSYVTSCSEDASSTKVKAASITGVPDCCGGEDSIYPCNSDGSMPTGTLRWICTLGSSTCAGVATATTTWA